MKLNKHRTQIGSGGRGADAGGIAAFAQQQREHGRSSEGQRTEGRPFRAATMTAAPRRLVRNQTPRAEAPRRSKRREPKRPDQSLRVPSRLARSRRASKTAASRRRRAYRNDGRRDNDRTTGDDRGVVVAPRAVPRSQVIVPRGDHGVVGRAVTAASLCAANLRSATAPYGFRRYGYRPYVFPARDAPIVRSVSRLHGSILLRVFVPGAGLRLRRTLGTGLHHPGTRRCMAASRWRSRRNDAQVFVDGEYVGQVSDFDGTNAPLNLTAGQHRIQVPRRDTSR